MSIILANFGKYAISDCPFIFLFVCFMAISPPIPDIWLINLEMVMVKVMAKVKIDGRNSPFS